MAPRTLIVHYGTGSFPVEINTNETIADWIEKILQSQNLQESNARGYFLTFLDSTERLTEQGLRRCRSRAPQVQLIALPVAQVREAIHQLEISSSAPDQKRILQQIQQKLTDREFADIFVQNKAHIELLGLVKESAGNTLALALGSFHGLLDHEDVWSSMDDSFVKRILDITINESLNTVARAAIAIFSKLVQIDRHKSDHFDQRLLFQQIEDKEDELSNSLVARVQSADEVLRGLTLQLINSLLGRSVGDTTRLIGRIQCGGGLEDLLLSRTMRQAIQCFETMDNSTEMKRHLLDYQRFFTRDLALRRDIALNLSAVDGPLKQHNARVVSKLKACFHSQGEEFPWESLGLEENSWGEIERAGLLGLENLADFLEEEKEYWRTWGHAEPGIIPFSLCKASIDTTEILSDIWGITSGVATSTSTFVGLLSFELFHGLLLRRMYDVWLESEPDTPRDASRVVSMMRSHARRHLANKDDERPRSLGLFGGSMHATAMSIAGNPDTKPEPAAIRRQVIDRLSKAIIGTNLNVIRDQFAKDLENDEELMNRQSVRQMKDDKHKEAFEFIKRQRIGCLKRGTWFEVARVDTQKFSLPGRSQRPMSTTIRYRFVRLSKDESMICWEIFDDIQANSPQAEDLANRIQIPSISDIDMSYRAGEKSPLRARSSTIMSRPGVPGLSLTFSILTGAETVALECVCRTSAEYSEWTDGLNLLLDRSIVNRDTSEFINSVGEMDMKLQLLDFNAETEDQFFVAPTAPPIPKCKDNYYFSKPGYIPSRKIAIV